MEKSSFEFRNKLGGPFQRDDFSGCRAPEFRLIDSPASGTIGMLPPGINQAQIGLFLGFVLCVGLGNELIRIIIRTDKIVVRGFLSHHPTISPFRIFPISYLYHILSNLSTLVNTATIKKMKEDIKYLLALNRHLKLGPARLLYLKKLFKSNWERAYRLQTNLKINPEVVQAVREAQKQFSPEREAEIVRRLHLNIVVIDDADYPELLREISDPPIILYYRGKLDCLKNVCIAIVGSRQATSYGRLMTEKIAAPLVQNGATVISGLALGIDSAAHRAALDNDGLTVGVLACGLDEVYPPSNRGLAEKIITSGAAIISENPPGFRAQKFNFPVRNRIIAGLSQAVIIVEAMQKSGALLTAAAALEYNRDLFAVPGDAIRLQAEGTNNLIKMGAKPVTCAEDVMLELNIAQKVQQAQARQVIAETPEEGKLLEHLGSEPVHIDTLVKSTQFDTGRVSSILTLLEIKGRIRNLGGGNYIVLR